MQKRRARWLIILLTLITLLLCLTTGAVCEGTELPFVGNIQEALSFLDFPEENGKTDVTRGRIRYIAQKKDAPYFLDEYWIGGERGGIMDLTIDRIDGRKYPSYCDTMCTRAVCSMALSYLGYDVTPGDMSAMLGKRDINVPYDEVTDLMDGLYRVTAGELSSFEKKYEKYLSDPNYSPIMLQIEKTNGRPHSLLIIGKDKDGLYLVVDPADRYVNNELATIQSIRLSKRTIVYCSTSGTYNGAKVMQCYQWYRNDGE